MPHHREVDQLVSPCLEEEKVPNDQGDAKILRDNLEEDMHKISFNESQHKVVKSHRVSTLDDHTSPMKFKECVIMFDIWKHPTTLDNPTRSYAEATSSSFQFMIAENERMDTS